MVRAMVVNMRQAEGRQAVTEWKETTTAAEHRLPREAVQPLEVW